LRCAGAFRESFFCLQIKSAARGLPKFLNYCVLVFLICDETLYPARAAALNNFMLDL
jgi:hypothetical protein